MIRLSLYTFAAVLPMKTLYRAASHEIRSRRWYLLDRNGIVASAGLPVQAAPVVADVAQLVARDIFRITINISLGCCRAPRKVQSAVTVTLPSDISVEYNRRLTALHAASLAIRAADESKVHVGALRPILFEQRSTA